MAFTTRPHTASTVTLLLLSACVTHEVPWDGRGCWDPDVPLDDPDAVTGIGASANQLIDAVNATSRLALELRPDADLEGAVPQSAEIDLQLGDFLSGFERQYLDEDHDVSPCVGGPVIRIEVETTLSSDALGPGAGVLVVWARDTDADSIWMGGSVKLEEPPSWLSDLEEEPADIARLVFDAVAYIERDDPGGSWAAPSGRVRVESSSYRSRGTYSFDEAVHVEG